MAILEGWIIRQEAIIGDVGYDASLGCGVMARRLTLFCMRRSGQLDVILQAANVLILSTNTCVCQWLVGACCTVIE
jgi:hypothetical protein